MSIQEKKNHLDYTEEVKAICSSKYYLKKRREFCKDCANKLDQQEFNKLYDYTNFDLSDEYLHDALIFCEDINIVKYLLDNSIDINCEDQDGVRPIHMVCLNKNAFELLLYLINLGVDYTSKTKSTKYTVIHYLCQNTFENFLKSITYLLDLGFDINCLDSEFKPLHIICDRDNYEMIKWALTSNQFNLDLNIKSEYCDKQMNFRQILTIPTRQRLQIEGVFNF